MKFQMPKIDVSNIPGMKEAMPVIAKTGLKLKQYGPQIATGAGIVCIVGGMVMACQETSTLDDILEKHQLKKDEFETNLSDLKELIASGEVVPSEYSEADERKDRARLWVSKATDIVLHFAPSVCLAGLGIGLIIGGQHAMVKRNAAIGAAYLGLKKQFDGYRNRVKDAYGEEAELDVYYGRTVEKFKVTETDEAGKEHVKTVKVKKPADEAMSIYARWFDEGSRHFTNSADANFMFLADRLAQCNEILNRRGYLFLNEVYDMLDIPRTPEGQLVGWVKNEGPGGGDNFVDFGIFLSGDQGHRDFVNRVEKSVLLDFNVDGPIYDLL